MNIQQLAIASATRVLAAYDRALEHIQTLTMQRDAADAYIVELHKTIEELIAMLDAKVPADAGGSVGGPELANA